MEAEGGKVTATQGPADKQGPRPKGQELEKPQSAPLVGPAEGGKVWRG